MIEMVALAYSLQMYWSTVAHGRTIGIYDDQRESLKRYASSGWKSPYQSESDAAEQAHRLADGYNCSARHNFAVQHLLAAARFARLCFQVEATNSGKPFGAFYDEIISYATAAIFSSVAALEANINEFLQTHRMV